ncbi:DMT family transporter [Achromobacter spanius]|uniref:DMT family transporter n=1 Tax=Achromobacter spanius TaxID=217203 RepID=UPI0037F34598
MTKSTTAIGVLFGAGAGALWGLVFLAPKLVSDFGPLYLTVGRYVGFGAIAAVMLTRRWHAVRRSFGRSDLITVAKLSFVGNILYYVLLASAVELAGIATTSLIIGFLPVAVTIIGSRERNAVPLKALRLSLGLCAAGAVFIGWQAIMLPGTGELTHRIAGFLCGLGALVSWTWFAVKNSRWLLSRPDVSVHDWNLLTGLATGALSLFLVPVALLSDPHSHPVQDWTRLVAVSLGLAFFASIVGNACWNKMSRLLPLTLIGQMILFETLFALLYGLAWEQRLPHWSEAAAFFLVVCSVISCLAAHRTKTVRADP